MAFHLLRTHLGGKGGGGVKPPRYFHCVLHAKRGWVVPDGMYKCVRTKWKVPYCEFIGSEFVCCVIE